MRQPIHQIFQPAVMGQFVCIKQEFKKWLNEKLGIQQVSIRGEQIQKVLMIIHNLFTVCIGTSWKSQTYWLKLWGNSAGVVRCTANSIKLDCYFSADLMAEDEIGYIEDTKNKENYPDTVSMTENGMMLYYYYLFRVLL